MRYLFSLFVVLCSSLSLFADVVILKNGDRISGTIQALESGKVTIDTDYAGAIAITWSEVDRVESDGALVVRLSDGSIIEGTLSAPEAGQLVVAGGTPVGLDQVALIGQQVEEVDDPGLLEEWHGAANLGYTLARGNTDVTTLSFSVTPERVTDTDRMVAGFRVLKSTQNGVQSSNLYKGRFRYERTLRDRLFVYGDAQFERDEQEQLSLRTGQGGGFGIRFQPASHTSLALFGGLTFVQEKFENANRELQAQGVTGFELETAWLAPAVFSTKTQYLPLFTEDGRYRLEWEGGLTLPLFANFTFGISAFDSFDSRPPQPSIKRNDFGLLTTLGWKF